MLKKNLPVILLRGLILLPNNDIRLEFDNDISRNIIDVAEMFHDNELLVVSTKDYSEDLPRIEDLPHIGVISKVTHKMELPNGKTRVIIEGDRRANVCEYLNLNHANDVLESIIEDIEEIRINEEDEEINLRKLNYEIKNYVKNIPYISNSILNILDNNKKLSNLTDAIAPVLGIDNNRLYEYVLESNPVKRAEMILIDIYNETEMFRLEREIDNKVKDQLDNNQKEYLLREKIRLIKEELGDTSVKDVDGSSLKEKIDNLKAPKKIKNRLYDELNR
jgi:ATP-dependent Lon protease